VTDLPDYVTDLTPAVKLSPLERLAWAKLSVSEFVDKLAPHVWKAPLVGWRGNGSVIYGTVGTSFSKVARYIRTFGMHFRGAKRREVNELLLERSKILLHKRCCAWALEAFDNAGHDICHLESQLSSCVPAGCWGAAMRAFSDIIHQRAWDIRKALEEAKSRPVT